MEVLNTKQNQWSLFQHLRSTGRVQLPLSALALNTSKGQ